MNGLTSTLDLRKNARVDNLNGPIMMTMVVKRSASSSHSIVPSVKNRQTNASYILRVYLARVGAQRR